MNPESQKLFIKNNNVPAGITLAEVEASFASISKTSEGGVSLWNTELISHSLKPNFIKFLFNLSTLVLSNSVPRDANSKNEAGTKIRPICVPELFYKITSKALALTIDSSDLALAGQLGVKVESGAESIIHIINETLKSGQFSKCLKIDVENAFNSISRQYLFHLLKNSKFHRFFNFAYGISSEQIYQNFIISSQSRVRQGDPMSSYLFSLGIHPTICKIRSTFPDIAVFAYLDDIFVLTKRQKDLDNVLNLFSEEFFQFNLKINESKCEILTLNNPGEALGGFVGNDIDSFIGDKVSSIARSISLTSSLSFQNAFLLIKECINTKINWLARTCEPSVTTNHFFNVFNSISTELERRLDRQIEFKFLISLPIAQGGLGLTNYAEINHLAFTSSLASSFVTINNYLLNDPEYFNADLVQSIYSSVEEFLYSKDTGIDFVRPSEMKGCQKFLSKKFFVEKSIDSFQFIRQQYPLADHDIDQLFTQKSKMLLTCVPEKRIYTFSNDYFSIYLSAHLLLPLTEADNRGRCLVCKEKGSRTFHAFNCSNTNKLRIQRHDEVLKIIAQNSNLNVEAKVEGNNLRPDIVSGNTAYDLRIVGGSYKELSICVRNAEKSKIEKYQHLFENVQPLICFTSGGFSPEFLKFLKTFKLEAKTAELHCTVVKDSIRNYLAYKNIVTDNQLG
ncbi:hypothetical protein GEMRC1_013529 [Eukaryota sp. GEM-RC1]